MSRKHNCPKRGQHARSRYRQRLSARGMKTTPVMLPVEELRDIQTARKRRTGSQWPDARDDGDALAVTP